MQIIKTPQKNDNCYIVAISETEKQLLEKQKSAPVKKIVRKSIEKLLELNSEITIALKEAIEYNNTAYRSKIECTFTKVEIKKPIIKSKNRKK